MGEQRRREVNSNRLVLQTCLNGTWSDPVYALLDGVSFPFKHRTNRVFNLVVHCTDKEFQV